MTMPTRRDLMMQAALAGSTALLAGSPAFARDDKATPRKSLPPSITDMFTA